MTINDLIESAKQPFFNWGLNEAKGRGLSPLKGNPFPYFDDPIEAKLNSLLEERARRALTQREAQSNPKPTPSPLPSPTVTPTPTPQGQAPTGSNERDFYYNYDPYLEHMSDEQRKSLDIKQPNDVLHEVIQRVFPEDATRAAIVSRVEGGQSVYPKPNVNRLPGTHIGSTDVGPWMMNTGVRDDGGPTTFDDLLNRFPEQIKEMGIDPNSYGYGRENDWGDPISMEGIPDALFDPEINARVAKINFDDPGNKQGWWGRWFGLRNPNYPFKEEDFISKESPY